MIVKGITIHDDNLRLSAEEVARIMRFKGQSNYHFIVDESVVIPACPMNEICYHTGKGDDFSNLHTISIYICRGGADLGRYLKATKRAVNLAKGIMEQFQLTTADIYFHSDFERVNCPHRLIEYYKKKKRFISFFWRKNGEHNNHNYRRYR